MPETLRERTLQLTYEGHPSVSVMDRRLRVKDWWSEVDRKIEELVKSVMAVH